MGTAGECAAQLKKTYAKEIQAIETKLAYTPARIARITHLFTLLKDRTIEKIEKSARIPAESKMILFAKVSQTELVLPPNDDEMPGCGHTTAIGPSTDIANFDGQVTACIGFMANLDRASDADILVSMGHEIAHSIDPCALESEFAKFAKPDAAPFPSEATYPDVVSCLRGGPKGAPCQNSNLHCNTEKGIADKCNEYSSGVEGDATAKAAGLKECQDYVKLTPSCPWGSNPKKSLADASSARVDPEPVSQIRESFSDFVGAEVAGTILEEQVRSGKLRGQDRLDALIGIAADFASLHGRCEDGNSNDVHQPGKLRINQNFFSSASFANAICGKNPTPASLPGGPQKCSAF